MNKGRYLRFAFFVLGILLILGSISIMLTLGMNSRATSDAMGVTGLVGFALLAANLFIRSPISSQQTKTRL